MHSSVSLKAVRRAFIKVVLPEPLPPVMPIRYGLDIRLNENYFSIKTIVKMQKY